MRIFRIASHFLILFLGLPLVAPQVRAAEPSSDFAPDSVASELVLLAKSSSCANVRWEGRGRVPVGYIAGVALTFGRSFCRLKGLGGRMIGPAQIMSDARIGSKKNDALHWYRNRLERAGSDIESGGVETLKSLYLLTLGLGVRESSGNHTAGFDDQADHPTATTAEAGLFQTSYNALAYSDQLQKLYSEYQARPKGCFNRTFSENVDDLDIDVIGTGPGAEFQRFTKACPAFAVEFAAVMLRIGRTHYGPINRKEAQLQASCGDLLNSVESLIDENPEAVCNQLQ